jgi:hypothetical protein
VIFFYWDNGVPAGPRSSFSTTDRSHVMPQKSMRVHLEFWSWPRMLVTVAPTTETIATMSVAMRSKTKLLSDAQ